MCIRKHGGHRYMYRTFTTHYRRYQYTGRLLPLVSRRYFGISVSSPRRRTGAQALPRSHHHRCPLCRLPYATGAWCCGTAALSLPKLTVCALAIHGTVSASPGSSHLGARTWEPHQVPWEPQLEASTAAWARPHARALTRAHPRALTRAHARAPRRRVAHCSNRLTASGGGRTSGAHDARPQGHGTGHSSGQSSRPGRGCSGSSSTRRGRSRGGPTNWRSTGC